MKFLVLLPLFAALLVAGCGEKSSSEGSDSAGASAEPPADAAKKAPTDSPGKEPNPLLGDADVERLLKEAVDFDSIERRNGLIYQLNESEPYSGLTKMMYDSGQVQGLAQFKDGKPDGPATAWYENGQKSAERTYKDGKPDGLQTYWHKNGQKMGEATYKDGKVVDGSRKHWNSIGVEVETLEETRK